MTPVGDYQQCVIGDRPHRAHDGMLVCTGHAQELATSLREVEDETALLDPRKSLGGQGNTKTIGLASEQAPVRLDALVLADVRTTTSDPTTHATAPRPAPRGIGPMCLFCEHDTCRDWRTGRHRDHHDDEHDAGSDRLMSAFGTLHRAAQKVRAARRLTPPPFATVVSERRLLTAHLPWLLEQTWIPELHTQLRSLLTALKRTNGTLVLAAGRCETIRDGVECGGTVRDVAIHHDDGPDEPGFRCDRCHLVWLGTAAIRKRDQLARQHAEKRARA